MSSAAKLLRRHLRRQSLSAPPPISAFIPLKSPNPSPSSPLNPSNLPWNRPLPSHRPFSANISYRSFSWNSWSGAKETVAVDGGGGGADDGFVEISGTETGLRPLDDGSETALEIPNLELYDSGMVEEAIGHWYLPLVRPIISLLDGFHDVTGLPWWVVIVTSTMAFRATLLPVLILQLKKAGQIAAIFPKLPPPLPPPQSGRTFREQYRLFRKKKEELGCPSFMWNFAFLGVQLPCFLLWMTSIRRMSLDHHPGFETGGTLWFQNLTDFPHSILGSIFPLLIAGLHYTNIQISFQGSNVAKMPGIMGLLAKYYKLYLEIMAIPFLLVGFNIPQGSLVYWVTNSLLTSAQMLSLKNPHVREKLGLPDQKSSTKNDSQKNVLHEHSGQSEHRVFADTLPPNELLDLALDYRAGGHPDDALKLLRIAIDKDPELVRALVAMGEVYCSRGSLEEASDYFERAISKIQDLDSEEELGLLVLASFGAGFSCISQGRKLEGIEHLKRIAQLREPENPINKACYCKGLVLLGSILFQDGHKSEALKYLRRAAVHDPAVNAYIKECEA